MKSILITFVACFSFNLILDLNPTIAQTTIFYDSNWNQIFNAKNRKKAKFFRKIEFIDGLYKQSDYYVTKERDIKSVKFYSDENLSIPQGKQTAYYRNGNMQYEGQYDFGLKDGVWSYFWPTGRLREQGNFTKDYKDGKWVRHRSDGSLWAVEYYKNGQPVGSHHEYYPDGSLKASLTYEDGVLDGMFVSYYPDGTLAREEIYEQGEVIQASFFGHAGQDTSYFPYFTPPLFPGCKIGSKDLASQQNCATEKMYEFIHDKLEYPDAAQIYGKQGTAILCFTVTPEGELVDPFFIEDISEEIAFSCMQLFRKFPDWIPGKKDGIKEDIHFELPLTFQLN